MPASIFNGSFVKCLKNKLNLNESAYILTGSDDPTSVAQSAPRGSIYMRTGASGGAVYRKTDDGSSTNWTQFSDMGAASISQSEVILNTGNGFGSTSTVIRRFTNTEVNTGSDITYADSATLGATFTINTAGAYAVCYNDYKTVTYNFGISRNSTQLTTNIEAITTSHRLGMGTFDASYFGQVSAVVWCAVNDVIRPHVDGSGSYGTVAQTRFSIVRVA